MCNSKEKHDWEKCNEQICTQWRFGTWGSCSVSCGDGIETRDAVCTDLNGRHLDQSEFQFNFSWKKEKWFFPEKKEKKGEFIVEIEQFSSTQCYFFILSLWWGVVGKFLHIVSFSIEKKCDLLFIRLKSWKILVLQIEVLWIFHPFGWNFWEEMKLFSVVNSIC